MGQLNKFADAALAAEPEKQAQADALAEEIKSGGTIELPSRVSAEPYMKEYADLIAMYETEALPSPEHHVECEPFIAELEKLIADFEVAHDLEALYAITNLTAKEAANHPIRQPAKIALNSIVAKLNFLEEKTNIAGGQLAELKAQCRKLSQAVGMINGGVVDHMR